jgi:diaminohydroxyphosphoribosylaminopyrimidine deaminase/5-amino-6-(5-phosphoribosylamino)uracil reductase
MLAQMNHALFMHRCLELAAFGRGAVGNGALVGAVLVRDNQIIVEGYHESYGTPHAEVILLKNFTDPIEHGDTLYVNLEPCCHYGKNPPCTDAVIARGIKKVVYGMVDPDPRVSGKGIQQLQAAGIEVVGPIERASSEYLNKGFICVRTKGRPWITKKMAYNRAKLISKEDGSPLKITSHAQDVWSHTFFRAKQDAILIGIQTLESDDPILNTRFVQKDTATQADLKNKKSIQYQPWKIVFDPHGRAKREYKIFQNEGGTKTIMVTGTQLSSDARRSMDELQNLGVRVVSVPVVDGLFDWKSLWIILLEPDPSHHYGGITSILVEGGRRTASAFTEANIVDEDVVLAGA